MTKREKTEYKSFAQVGLKIRYGFAPNLNKIILLESAKNGDGHIEFVFCRIGKDHFYKVLYGSVIEVDERGFKQ
jgi:hypothetical protein